MRIRGFQKKEIKGGLRMPLLIIRNDITKVSCDAIVNAANQSLLGGGGVDGAIHRAAGKQLLEECRTLGGCPTGEAKITNGYRLPCRYVIHTVGPIWQGGSHHEEQLLRSCYRNSLALAWKYQCESIAFPLISSGAYGYPKAESLEIATDEIRRFLSDHDLLIYLVVFDKMNFEISRTLTDSLEEFIDQNYVDKHEDHSNRSRSFFGRKLISETGKSRKGAKKASSPSPMVSDSACLDAMPMEEPLEDLEQALLQIDESFSEMVLRKIDEKGITDVECYKRANMDRKLFSKIRSNRLYKPTKPTALALAISLELTLEETRELLMKAGFALSHSSKFDIIVEYFIRNHHYDIFRVNEALFSYDQKLLGLSS